MIYLIVDHATPQQIQEMLEAHHDYIKLAVDVERRVLAGGGIMHADCESVLLDDGSEQTDLWGVNWYPHSSAIRYESLINIRPKRGNRSMVIQDPALCKTVEGIVRERLAAT